MVKYAFLRIVMSYTFGSAPETLDILAFLGHSVNNIIVK